MKKYIKNILAGVLAGCMVIAGPMAAFAEEQVSFLLPIDYFCIEEDQTESTQEQLDEYSREGLKYEFTEDGQIICIVEDQEAALKAVVDTLEANFAEAQDPENSLYCKSYQKIEYNEDLSEITITCNKDDWGFFDGFLSSIFILSARDYQRISGIEEADMKCELAFVDENGEVIETDSFDNYREEETEAE